MNKEQILIAENAMYPILMERIVANTLFDESMDLKLPELMEVDREEFKKGMQLIRDAVRGNLKVVKNGVGFDKRALIPTLMQSFTKVELVTYIVNFITETKMFTMARIEAVLDAPEDAVSSSTRFKAMMEGMAFAKEEGGFKEGPGGAMLGLLELIGSLAEDMITSDKEEEDGRTSNPDETRNGTTDGGKPGPTDNTADNPTGKESDAGVHVGGQPREVEPDSSTDSQS